MQSYKSLKVWASAHEIALGAYKATENFPEQERYALVQQIRRSGLSIAANIAEGAARGTDRDFARFLKIALGSANELEYLLTLARDLTYLDRQTHGLMDSKLNEVKRMLFAFIRKLLTTAPGRIGKPDALPRGPS